MFHFFSLYSASALCLYHLKRGSCVRSADCKSTGFLWRSRLLTEGRPLTTGWTTSALCGWRQTLHQFSTLVCWAGIGQVLYTSGDVLIPHAAVYLGCLHHAGIPEVNGAGFRSDHCQNIPIFIPVHSHTTPTGRRERNFSDFSSPTRCHLI